jgi:hypothetical protein
VEDRSGGKVRSTDVDFAWSSLACVLAWLAF